MEGGGSAESLDKVPLHHYLAPGDSRFCPSDCAHSPLPRLSVDPPPSITSPASCMVPIAPVPVTVPTLDWASTTFQLRVGRELISRASVGTGRNGVTLYQNATHRMELKCVQRLCGPCIYVNM